MSFVTSKAIYAFSGDPITFGHIDVITKAAAFYDEVIVGIGVNPEKEGKHLFTLDERLVLTQKSLADLPNVSVTSFSGLLVDYAYEQCATTIIKGLRNDVDFSYEMLLDQIGKSQYQSINTLFLPAENDYYHVRSSVVKELQTHHGDIHRYVPLHVKQALEERITQQLIIGITGGMACGKSYVAQKLTALSSPELPIHHIEMDHIGHGILQSFADPRSQAVREEVIATFGSAIVKEDGLIDRKKLGAIVFADQHELAKLNDIMHEPLFYNFRKALHDKAGIILVNAALLAEWDASYICNNNIILVQTDEATQRKRLCRRGLTEEQITQRLASQYSQEKKQRVLEECIARDGHGMLWPVHSSDTTEVEAAGLLQKIRAAHIF